MAVSKFIANYTLACGRMYINHISTLSESGELLGLRKADGELACTRYVPGVLCLMPEGYPLEQLRGADLGAMKDALMHESARMGERVVAIELDLEANHASVLAK